MGDNQSDEITPIGCLIVFSIILFMLILAVFFPSTRDGMLAKPIVLLWEALFGVKIPTYNIGPIVLKALFLLFLATISFIGGISLARFLNNRFYGVDLNLQTIGALASILGLIIGILSLILK